MITWLVQFILCAADLNHCSRIAWTAGGPRCVEVTLAPSCESETGWHWVFGTAVCTRGCGAEGAPSS